MSHYREPSDLGSLGGMTHFQPSPLLVVVGLSLYLLPSLIAISRGTPHFVTGFLINLLLGWTVIGWMYSLAWAAFSDPAGQSQGELQLIPDTHKTQHTEQTQSLRRAA